MGKDSLAVRQLVGHPLPLPEPGPEGKHLWNTSMLFSDAKGAASDIAAQVEEL